MPNPYGNPGNKGGRPYSKENREKAATLKGLCLDWATEQMRKGDEDIRKQIVLKILPTCMPKIIEMDEENALTLGMIVLPKREVDEYAAKAKVDTNA